MDNNSLAGKTALVTGAVGGIGSAVCRDLAAAGITIIPIDIDAAALEALCQKLPARCYPLVVDVSDSSAVSEACQRAFNELAPADILVNCAGILSNNKLAATEVDEWRRVMAINVDGSLHTTQQVIPHMQAQRWGRIVNLAS